jgi:hypothetical protein
MDATKGLNNGTFEPSHVKPSDGAGCDVAGSNFLVELGEYEMMQVAGGYQTGGSGNT